MTANRAAAIPPAPQGVLLNPIARFRGLRALAWSGNILYASRGYRLLRASIADKQNPSAEIRWQSVGYYRPPFWRNISSNVALASRLCRDGFHAMAVLPSSAIVAGVPGAILLLTHGAKEFRTTRRITRGTRPLHITAIPNGPVLWGEYFDNPARDEVHIYASDTGLHWDVAYTFPRGSIRHVHNIVHDPWRSCLWILTGDYGDECRILRASYDLSNVEAILQGNQQMRAAAAIPTQDGLYFSSDTPLEQNHIWHLDRNEGLSNLAPISGSSIYGCRVAGNFFFSTMVEPGSVNTDRHVRIYGSRDGESWNPLLAWKKDGWPMRLFQHGNAFLPDGINTANVLALTTMAVQSDDMVTSLYSLSAP